MKFATCHPERKHMAKGQCNACYRREQMKARRRASGAQPPARARIPECHPERKHAAQGLCKACYRRQWLEAHPEAKQRARAEAKAWALQNPEKRRAQKLRVYGLTPADFDAMLIAQGGKCALCRQQRKLCVDHDHATGKVRGLLCKPCNQTMGDVDADETMIDRIAAYARRVPKLTLVK